MSRKGDGVFYYHTGNEKSVVGIAKATSDAYPDPKDKSGKLVVVDIAPVQALKRPVTLAEIKASKAFASFPLTRFPRLSVMPVSDAEWKEIERLSESPNPQSYQRRTRLPLHSGPSNTYFHSGFCRSSLSARQI